MTMTIYAERSVTLVRVIKAPRDLVWNAWTDVAMLKEWWGPEQFTNPRVEGDVRVGGVMHITMHGPKGSPFDIDFPMVKRYREVVLGKKLVFDNEPLGPNGEKLMEGLTVVTFESHPEGTLVEVTTSAKALVPEAVGMLGGMDQGWSQSLDKLARLLEK
ncbi:MAG TPA: SRPBCC domain-containing protein [Rhizomicrobium sp.]|nr:SRPBCC domain-containing protein [Rhizomicrobium sp.]